MDGIARILASKWFAVTACALPGVFLLWEYSAALRDVESSSASPSVVPVQVGSGSEENRTDSGSGEGGDGNVSRVDETGDSVEYADFLFLATEEEFREATLGTFAEEGNATSPVIPPSESDGNLTEENSTSQESEDPGFSFTVSDEEFVRATEALDIEPGDDLEEVIKRRAEEASEETLAGANLNERFIRKTGDVAVAFVIIVLCLTPIRRLAPRAKLASALNRHRRLVGLSAFFYACLHFTLYFDDGLNRLLNEWNLFYIQCGLASFLTMFALAVTSNNRAVRKLGGKRWKKLHRLLYLAVPLLFYHKGWTGKAEPEQIREACVWFAPMLLLQIARILKWRASLKKKHAKGESE